MPLRAEDLPAHVRERLGIIKKSGARPAGRTLTSGGRWRCPRCPDLEPFTTWASVERHRDELGHGRYEIVVSGG